jgi:Acetyltransferase (GNAT) family
MKQDNEIIFKPLNEKTWQDWVTLFGSRGACGGCWCMWWRMNRKEFEENKGMKNRRTMKKLVKKGEFIGIIAYRNRKPIGWCAFAPREKFIRLDKSRVLKRIDDQPVWSIPCFFITKGERRKGLSAEILMGVIDYCQKKKIKILEAYPILPYSSNIPSPFAYTGILSTFLKVGFKIAKKWSKARPIVRLSL